MVYDWIDVLVEFFLREDIRYKFCGLVCSLIILVGFEENNFGSLFFCCEVCD